MAQAGNDETGEIEVEVAYALPNSQVLIRLRLPAGSVVADAIAAAALARRFPDHDLATAAVGIWGHVVSRADRLRDGDRVEAYRPLKIDPREARRRLAESGHTMMGRDQLDD